jgi:hypothetical protein
MQAPTAVGLNEWSVLLFPSASLERSKTGQTDESVAFVSPQLRALTPVWELLSKMPKDEILIGMSHAEFCCEIAQVCKELQIPHVTPGRGRHSGASIAVAVDGMSLVDLQRLGRWKSPSSVGRYEKRNLLNMTWNALSEPQRVHFLECDAQLNGVILRGARPLGIPSGVLLGRSSATKRSADARASMGDAVFGEEGINSSSVVRRRVLQRNTPRG